jgi:hypothetical protein
MLRYRSAIEDAKIGDTSERYIARSRKAALRG